MRNTSSGILIVSSIEEGTQKEMETFTCAHCSFVGILLKDQQKTQDGGFCMKCCKLLCQKPQCHTNCSPYKAKLETPRMQIKIY